jgi:DNA-binding transcriptional MerR regulator
LLAKIKLKNSSNLISVIAVDSKRWLWCCVSVKNFFEQFRDEKFLGVGELAAAATRILIEDNMIQSRETVTASPDERTVRYYLSENLISASEEKRGTATVYSYFHLLQLLAIKKLQAEHLSIRQIRKMITEQSENQLEDLLANKQNAKNEAQKFLESLLSSTSQSTPEERASFAKLPRQPSIPVAKTSAEPDASRQFPILNKDVWSRFEIETGLELHINENFVAPADDTKVEWLLQKIRLLIEKYRSSKLV